jgi:hypothetical protein
MPPLVIPDVSAHEAMITFLDKEEIMAIAGLLTKYQRSGIGWDEWIVKNWPIGLVDKWKDVLKLCRANGFINPRAYGEKIKWHQILKHSKDKQAIDQCVLCPNKFDDCTGTANERKEFKPCWQKGG